MRFRVILGISWLFWTLLACQAAPVDGATLPAASVAALPPAASTPGKLPLPAPTLLTTPAASATWQPTPVDTLLPTAPEPLPLLICSPLAETSLLELAEIVSDPYNPPPMGKDERHQGVDFAYYQRGDRTSIAGATVQAVLPGQVAFAQGDRLPYGNLVIIETDPNALPAELIASLGIGAGESLYQLYAHLAGPPLVEQDQPVFCGQALGAVGQTGYNIPVPHLHLELRIGPAGARFTGMAFYDTRASQLEMETYRLWRMSGAFQHIDPMAFIQEFLRN